MLGMVMYSTHKSASGFTLIELLIVIPMIAMTISNSMSVKPDSLL